MKIITVYIAVFLCLALCVLDALGGYEAPGAWTSRFEMWIPEDNTYLEKVPRPDRVYSDHAMWYEGITYKKPITEEDLFFADYHIMKMENGWSVSWSSVEKGSVALCSDEQGTQDGTIAAVVRLVLGMSDGCPAPEGYKDMSWFHFATTHTFVFNHDLGNEKLKIDVNTHNWNDESIFRGEFYVVPAGESGTPLY